MSGRKNKWQTIANKIVAQFREATGRDISIGEPIRSKMKLGMLFMLLKQMDPEWEPYGTDGGTGQTVHNG